MPMTWSIDHAAKQIRATASGTLSAEDISTYLAAMPAEGALGYRSILDVSSALAHLSTGDLKAFSELVAGRKVDGLDGAIALVVISEAERDIASMFAAKTAQRRRVRVFPSVGEAKAWFSKLDDEADNRAGGD